jgi:hypothetical protein
MALGNKCSVCGSKDYEKYIGEDGKEYGKCYNLKCIMGNKR